MAFQLQLPLRRLAVSSFLTDPIASMYRVEVSGWDRSQAFFVEKAELEWSEGCGKQVLLSHAIPDGAVIFLRLVPYFSVDRSDPVPYETELLGTTPPRAYTCSACIRSGHAPATATPPSTSFRLQSSLHRSESVHSRRIGVSPFPSSTTLPRVYAHARRGRSLASTLIRWRLASPLDLPRIAQQQSGPILVAYGTPLAFCTPRGHRLFQNR